MTSEHIGHQLGSYQLLRLLGRGAFAEVYLGEHIHLKSLAAIKVLYTRLADELEVSFLNEARILARLAHPHIIRILDYGIQEGIPFLVMEYAPHGTLRQRHPRNTRLDLTTVVAYVRQIADGLQYAHDQKLIHRDLKPENLLIGQRDELLLSDFGVALIAQTTRANDSSSAFAGTAAYMAPEQLQGRPVFASDQYSLGVMIYEWLCGARPFQGTFLEMYSQHTSVPPAPLHEHIPQIPPAVEEVVLTALAKEPEQRFASVRAFATAFEQASQPLLSLSGQPSQSSGSIPATVPQLAFPDPAALQSATPTTDQIALAQTAAPISNSHIVQSDPASAPTPSIRSGIIGPFPFATPAQPGAAPDYATTPLVSSPDSTPTPLAGWQSLPRGTMSGAWHQKLFQRKVALIAGLVLLALVGVNIGIISAFNSGPHRSGGATPIARSGQSAPHNGATATTVPALASEPVARATRAATATAGAQPTAPAASPTTISPTQPPPTPTPTQLPSPMPTPPGGPILVYSSSLSSQDAVGWDIFNYSGGGGCGFSGGAYHATMPQAGHVAVCTAEGSNVSNFIYQMQMTLLQGDGGGLLFRSSSTGFYRFRIGIDGTYDLVDQAVTLASGSSSAIKTGAGQTNIVKVVAQGSTIALYVNGQLLTVVHDSSSTSGKFGVFGVDFVNSTDAAFSNARVWQL